MRKHALAKVQAWVEDNGLTLHPTKTKIVDARTEGFDFLGYTFRGELASAAEEEPGQVEGRPPSQDGAQQRAQPDADRRVAESNAARMVWLLSALSAERVRGPGQLDARPIAQHPAEACASTRSGPRRGPSTLAERLLRRPGPLQLVWRPWTVAPVPHGLIINWRAGCGKPACPVRREGQPTRLSLPLSIDSSLRDSRSVSRPRDLLLGTCNQN